MNECKPLAAGTRYVADTLMVLQDLATARGPLSPDAETVAVAACSAFRAILGGSDDVRAASTRLIATAPPPSEHANLSRRDGLVKLGGHTGYDYSSNAAEKRSDKRRDSRPDRPDRRYADDVGLHRSSGRDAPRDRFGDSREPRREQNDRFAQKPGAWNCPDCGFSNFASRTSCMKCDMRNGSAPEGARGRGLHSLTLQLNLSNSTTHS